MCSLSLNRCFHLPVSHDKSGIVEKKAFGERLSFPKSLELYLVLLEERS